MTPAENIARAFGGEFRNGQGFIPTPGHTGKDRGTTVRDADDGGVVFHSFNGGDWRALKEDCERRGLLPERERTERNRDVGTWDYTDASGVVLYRKVRTALPDGQKSYRFEHPNGRGGWNPKRGDAVLVPYRLPDLVGAPHDAVIYMAEGEKQADKLAGWGLVATSSKDWRGADFAGYVRGRTVVILPDNDEQGAKIAADAKAAVERAEGTAFLLDLPGLPPKGDVMDWCGTADDLRALTDATLCPPSETFELADLDEWANTTPTPKAFVMAPFIPRDDVVIITGDGGTNKSTLALQLSACAAAGRQFLGMSVTPGPALYVTAEDDNRENHWRTSKIAATIGTTLHDLAGRLHIVSLRGRMNNELATFEQDGRLRSTSAYALLRATIQKTGAKLVTLDNVAHLFAGNENDRGQVTAFINLLYQLCGDLGVTILLVAHRNKSGDSYSGSTAWLNAVRSQVLLERSEDGDADARRMSLGKANYARAGEDLSFRWHDFALVRDADLPDDQREELALATKAARENTIFLDCLRERAKQGDGRAVGPAVGPSYAPKQFEGMAQAKGLKSAQFKLAMDRLFSIGAIESHTYRNTGKGRDVTIIREATEPPRTTTPNVPRTLVPSHPEPQYRTTPRTYSISKDITGAATGAAAPDPDDIDWASDHEFGSDQ